MRTFIQQHFLLHRCGSLLYFPPLSLRGCVYPADSRYQESCHLWSLLSVRVSDWQRSHTLSLRQLRAKVYFGFLLQLACIFTQPAGVGALWNLLKCWDETRLWIWRSSERLAERIDSKLSPSKRLWYSGGANWTCWQAGRGAQVTINMSGLMSLRNCYFFPPLLWPQHIKPSR